MHPILQRRKTKALRNKGLSDSSEEPRATPKSLRIQNLIMFTDPMLPLQCLSLVSHLASDPPPSTPPTPPGSSRIPRAADRAFRGQELLGQAPTPGLPEPKAVHSPSRCLQEGLWGFLFLILLLSPPPEHRLSYCPSGSPGASQECSAVSQPSNRG